jgi:hypothetical protein
MTNSLPPQGPNEPDNPMSGEAELRALYGKLPQNEPGPALDAAVLRAAAEAVSSQRDHVSAGHSPARKVRNRPPRWLIGLGSAAILVLAVGLAWRMRSMPQVDSQPAVTEEVTAKASSNPAMDDSPVNSSAGTLAPAITPPSPPPPPMRAMQPPPLRVIQAARSQRSMKTVAERARIQTGRQQMAADMPPASPAEATATLGEVEQERARVAPEARSTADKLAAPAPPIISAAPIQPPTPTPELSLSIPPPAPPAPPTSSAPPARTPATAATPAAQAAAQADELQTEGGTPAQSAEVDAIRQLFAQHHDEEAQRRLESFHRSHPQWQLSPELQARLRKP